MSGASSRGGSEELSVVTTTDGLALAVTATGPKDAPTLVCVHGYPDNRSIWDGIVGELSGRYRVVTYDVRGAGNSQAPRTRSGYGLDQLSADLDAVIEAVCPDRPVHLLGHDWGSIQTWHAVTGDGPSARAASFTSISGPSLDLAALWMAGRGARAHRTDDQAVPVVGLHRLVPRAVAPGGDVAQCRRDPYRPGDRGHRFPR
ncbi:MAG: alpha/beta fold hydrolase [Dietzia maris]